VTLPMDGTLNNTPAFPFSMEKRDDVIKYLV
jgi:hypothetical protein